MNNILIAGASGYVGGRLLKCLLDRDLHLRCLARRTEGLQARFGDQVELIQGNLMEPESLAPALVGMDSAVYLVHSMGSPGDFEERERICAQNFAKAAQEAGLKRIVYLGGLCDERVPLSPHMNSRMETGRILRESGIPVLELRASIVLGAGSLSFEMIRALVQRLPVMITPKWVHVKAQPIFIDDLLSCLEESLFVPLSSSQVVEVGGKDVTSYLGIMKAYAQERGLHRIYLPVPFLSPTLSSLWLGLVTPLFARVGRHLIESVTHPSIINNPDSMDMFSVQPRGVQEAVRDALAEEEKGLAETRWSDSLTSGQTHKTWAGVRFGTRLFDVRMREADCSPEEVFQTFMRIGGKQGWFFANWLWQIRGIMDELIGGVGMRRGRKDPERVQPGDVVDCWRVSTVEEGRRLRLRAEMKLPGRAWLEFEVTPLEHGRSQLRQTAVFDPLGLMGLLYWYSIFPLHEVIFRGMIAQIVRAAEEGKASAETPF